MESLIGWLIEGESCYTDISLDTIEICPQAKIQPDRLKNTCAIRHKPMTKMESSDWLVNWRKRLPTCMSLGTTKICPDTKNQPIRLKNKRNMGKKLYFSFFSLCVCSGSGRVSGRAKLTQTSKRTSATASQQARPGQTRVDTNAAQTSSVSAQTWSVRAQTRFIG